MIRVIALLIITIIISGCGSNEKAEELPPLVRVTEVGGSNGAVANEYAGKVVSRYETPLSFQVGGKISARYADAGTVAKKGDLIMSLNRDDTAASVDAAMADVNAKRAESELARINLTRAEELFNAAAIAKSQLDDAKTRAEANAAALNAAIANLTRARNANDYTNLTAPMDGVITSVTGEVGQITQAGAVVATIADNAALEAEIDLPETEFSSVFEGMPAECSFYGIDGTFQGTVREISPYANSVSRTYRLRISVHAPPNGLTLGRSAKIRFNRPQTKATVPLTAIDSDDNGSFCWVVEEGRVHRRYVTLEIGENNTAKVNLDKGAAVVTAGIHLLKENMAVRRDDVK